METYKIQSNIIERLQSQGIDTSKKDKAFAERFIEKWNDLQWHYHELYFHHQHNEIVWHQLIDDIISKYKERSATLKKSDKDKFKSGKWFLSNSITGMSLYVDRFCGKINNLESKLPYLQELGVNLLHLMPLFESPEGESDGGYAVSDFRKIDERYGNIDDLIKLRKQMSKDNMYLMLDIVLNHTSYHHEWAKKAKSGDAFYQDYFYMFDNRDMPDQYDAYMPEIFPESAPGSFSYVPECNKWVMTVFHKYQWDLNFRNPFVFREMMENILYYANLGVDILRIDAPAFIWKEPGTTCQNLPKAHTLLRLIKLIVEITAPGMALLGEAIVSPNEIMKYFGTDGFQTRECDFAYNATHMALQWDMLATGDTKVMLAAQHEILQKPYGTSWITYTRCHDDIGLGYDDAMISHAGYNPYDHRSFLKDFYSGNHPFSTARGALFSSNPKTGDARISGSLASLCGLEVALENNNSLAIQTAVNKILLMQAHSFFLGGIPMIFYGDEAGYTNDYSYLHDPSKSYDNRWMHRPIINWEKNENIHHKGSIESIVFEGTQKLIAIRNKIPAFADIKNMIWLTPHNHRIAGYLRHNIESNVFCVFNFSNEYTDLTWYAFKEKHLRPFQLFDHWSGHTFNIGNNHEYMTLAPYQFCVLEVVV